MCIAGVSPTFSIYAQVKGHCTSSNLYLCNRPSAFFAKSVEGTSSSRLSVGGFKELEGATQRIWTLYTCWNNESMAKRFFLHILVISPLVLFRFRRACQGINAHDTRPISCCNAAANFPILGCSQAYFSPFRYL